ncbi:LysR family transcriptional regulator [Marinobacter sp. LN3S78]|uniref:LysR family transcriptional regulator n=1 Tax=Marinobacter sp. LN3S78 TaxID=3382300 RepID=UPI00387AA951
MDNKQTAIPHISLEQWRSLVAVVDEGGYARAAEALHKSQSSITYAVQRLEHVLEVKVFTIQGRRAVLTPVGQMLYQRACQLLEDSLAMERAAGRASAGWESEIAIAVEVLFPTWLLLECLDAFGEVSPQTRINLYETVLDGGTELLQQGKVDLAILPKAPPGYHGEVLQPGARIIPVAHPDHPLHQVEGELSLRDLRKHRHIVVRDTSARRDDRTRTVDVARRWTVTNMATLIGAVSRGYGFAWMAADKIRHELEAGVLKPLPLSGGERLADLYLVFADAEAVGPGVRRLAEILRDKVKPVCPSRPSLPS